MRPFDLLEALAGEKVITRCGEDVVLTSFEIGELYPLRGAIIGAHAWKACWTDEGSDSLMFSSSPHDLFMKED